MTRTSSRFTSWFMAFALAVALVAVVPAFQGSAHAYTTTNGRLHNFRWNEETKTGRVTLRNSNGYSHYRVTQSTDCGWHTGNAGGPIPCRTLGQDRYRNKPTRIQWVRTAAGNRRAVQVSVDIR